MINGTFENTPVRHISGKAEVYTTSAAAASGANITLNNLAQGENINISLSNINLLNFRNYTLYEATVEELGENHITLNSLSNEAYMKIKMPTVDTGYYTVHFDFEVLEQGENVTFPATQEIKAYTGSNAAAITKTITGLGSYVFTQRLRVNNTTDISIGLIGCKCKISNLIMLQGNQTTAQFPQMPYYIDYSGITLMATGGGYTNSIKVNKDGNATITAFHNTLTITTDNAEAVTIDADYKTATVLDTYKHTDRLKSFDLERLGESKFFGYGIAQKANIKLIDTNRELDFTTADRFKLYLNDTGFTPDLKVTEVHRDEKTNALSITVYDALEQAQKRIVAELPITSYTIGQFAQACAALLGVEAVLEPLEEFNTFYDGGANFEGTETIREALNDVAEATQTIYFLNNNNQLVFKRLDMAADPVATIDKENYIELDSKTNRRLVGICAATELGDNVEATLSESGTTQYVRDNAFWTLRTDIDTIVEKALEAVGGFTIAQFNCKWRGNYLLEIGDKIALQTKDNNTIISYLLNDSLGYDGALTQKTQWEYEDTEESANNPSTLGEILKYTYAKVDKQEKQIDLVASEIGVAQSEIAAMQITTDKISTSVQAVEKTATDAVESLNKEVSTLTQKVEAQITAEDLTVEVQKALADGVKEVTTTTGFTFNEDGLKIAKSDSEINTTVTEDGMRIKKGNKEVLTANNEGVKAIDLHATTFLIIGKNSRFEDYKSSRTACFWIGG